MSDITLVRTGEPKPTGATLETIRRFLFGCFKGGTDLDDKRWNRFWNTAIEKEAGEMFDIETVFPRHSLYHRRHMKIEQDVFRAQDRFKDFEMFRNWLKIGAGFVIWTPGAKGGIVPLPKSISYATTDEAEFREYHDNVVAFLRGDHAAPYLWKHLGDKSHEMMDAILQEFNE